LNTLQRKRTASCRIFGASVAPPPTRNRTGRMHGFSERERAEDRSGRQDAYYPLKASRDAAKYAPGVLSARHMSSV